MAQSRMILNKARIRILVALIIVALVSTLSLLVMWRLSNTQQLDANIINQAGRQRMLSQRIALGTQLFVKELHQHNKVSHKTRSLIKESANLMLSSHDGLIYATDFEEIQQLYFEGEPSLDKDIRAYVKAALHLLENTDIKHINEAELSLFDLENVNYLLFRLNLIVNAYESAAEHKVSNSMRTGFIIWMMTLLTLLLEFIYILKPTLMLIKEGFKQQAAKQKRFQLAADSAQLGIWEYDLNTRTLYWDAKIWDIFYETLPQESPVSFEIFENRLYPADKASVIYHFTNAIENTQNMDLTFRITTPNHTLKYIHAYSIIEYDSYGQAIRIIGTNKDITESIQKEEALIEAKEKAEAATRIKGDFLASMSHEIRTPLNGVMGMLGLLTNTALTQQQSQRVSIALSSARSLLALINDILDFSKIEADKLEIETIDFDINKVLGEIVESLGQLAENKGIELVLDTIKVGSSRVLGDPGRIRQLITNLLANAIKFTHEGHVIVSVSLEPNSQDNWQLNFSVEDTGIGIAEDQQAHLFDAFSQVDASTTREYGGTGLGLAIVKRLCIAMGGVINVSSQKGRGSRFYGHILLGKSEHGAIIAPTFDVSSLNILVVDDNSVNLSILSEQLQHWGINVTCANSGKQAINICEQRFNSKEPHFDIAILDMQMPNMDGAELGEILKHDERFAPMHLVMMTSMIMDNDNQHMADIGFCAYFAKPVTTADLFLALSVIGENGEALRKATPLLTHDYLNSLTTIQDVPSVNLKSYVSQLNNPHVLVVEDNSINQLVVTDMLEDLGFTVTCATDGLDAINKLNAKTTPFCLIFMDCQMPNMDGYEATQKIRKGLAGRIHIDTPIVALTANTMKGDQQKCLESGMSDFMPKPLEQEVLKRMLVSWLFPNLKS